MVVAFGQLLPQALLDALPHGFVNVHFSLLPRWRGAAPVERAMLAGDTETGVCIMALEAGLDTGPVYARTVCADRLRTRPRASCGLGSSTLGTELLVDDAARPSPLRRRDRRRASPPTPTSSPSRSSSSTGTRPAADLARIVRAGNPRPGAWTTDHGTRLKIWRARPLSAGIDAPPGTVFGHTRVATGDGALELVEVQPEGRRVMPANAWLAGRRSPSTLLGT